MARRLKIWGAYGLALSALWLWFFAGVAGLPLDLDDDKYLADSAAASEDIASLWAQDKQMPGRPVVDLALWATYEFWGDDIAVFHLLSALCHAIAALALAVVARRLGSGRAEAMLGGTLFLVCCAHFRAVYWISALGYPLALSLVLLGLLCFGEYLRGRGISYGLGASIALGTGVLAHPAAIVGWAAYMGAALVVRPASVGRGAVLPVATAIGCFGLLTQAYPDAPQFVQSQYPVSAADIAVVFFWLASRLLTTAHWLPLPLRELAGWEIGLGAVLVAGFAVALWRSVRTTGWTISPHLYWAGWALLWLAPFLSRTPAFLQSIDSGPSRYLYFAAAGSSLLLAWGLAALGRVGGRGIGLAAGAVVSLGILISSREALGRAEANAYGSAGYNNHFRSLYSYQPEYLELGIAQLERALAGDGRVVAEDRAYYMLVEMLLQAGVDPRPVIEEALRQFPGDLPLRTVGVLAGNREICVSEESEPCLPGFANTGTVALTPASASPETYKVFATAYHRVGKRFLRQRDYRRAAVFLATSIRACELGYSDSTYSYLSVKDALFGLAASHVMNDQADRAIEIYAEILESEPQNSVARYNIALLYYLSDRRDLFGEHRALLAEVDRGMAGALESLVAPGVGNVELGLVLPGYRY